MIVAQISDPHITEVGGEADRKYATAEHLRRAVAHLMALPARPDIVLLTGDCVDGGKPSECRRFLDLLAP